jgi:hypothetical protein
MKTTKTICFLLFLFITFNVLSQGSINGLQILPSNPATHHQLKVVATTAFNSGPCGMISSQYTVSGNTINVSVSHTLGMLTVICPSSDTIPIGQFAAGTYTLYYNLTTPNSSSVYDTDTLIFTVQNTTGIRTSSSHPDPKVYPNPTHGIFYADVPEGYIASIINILGVRFPLNTLPGRHQEINIGHLPDGWYVVEFSSPEHLRRVKILKL